MVNLRHICVSVCVHCCSWSTSDFIQPNVIINFIKQKSNDKKISILEPVHEKFPWLVKTRCICTVSIYTASNRSSELNRLSRAITL